VLKFEPFQADLDDWGRVLSAHPEHHVFQTPAWLAFVAETHGGTPVLATLTEGREPVGYFAGLMIRRFGAKILGSPFPGWNTEYMGFQLHDGVSRKQAARALVEYAFGQLRCVHLEFRDRTFDPADVEGLGFDVQTTGGYEVDLTPAEPEILARMEQRSRWAIRKAVRMGVTIEEAQDDNFAEDYYAQLRDVFAKQRLVPTYDEERIRGLIRLLLPTGMLLLLRARDAEGRCVATGIFLGAGSRMFFWGGASWRQYQLLRPNELLMWHAMRYWKRRGVRFCDLGGGGDYKRKFGPYQIHVPRFLKSRLPLVPQVRDAARRLVGLKQRVVGRMSAWTGSPPS
jgi:CelD/BcsL family acetyltransferase involved in cellulose biosynthesis